MIGTAILSEYQEPVEEIIFHDKLYGKSIAETLNLLVSKLDKDGRWVFSGLYNTPRATVRDHASGCDFCWWFLGFRSVQKLGKSCRESNI